MIGWILQCLKKVNVDSTEEQTDLSEMQKCTKDFSEDGVKYFRDTLRPHFIKGAQNVFLWRFYLNYSSKERNH